MIKLFDKESGAYMATITEEELQFLMDHFEEESTEDVDYYFSQVEIDWLESLGAPSHLIAVLRDALGAADGFEMFWERVEA